MRTILLLTLLIFCNGSANAYQMHPDGSYGTGNGSYLRPDGSYGNTLDYEMAPDGSYIDKD